MSDKVCAIIVEPVQGEGGIYPASAEFLQGLRALADEYDALLIFDEVQCGMGRTGKLWAYEHYGVEPDILTAAKPLAGGLPIGAILMRQKVADAMHKGDHASTFAGGPLTTHVAHHVVSRVADPAFLAAVEAKGQAVDGTARRNQQPAHRGNPRQGVDGRHGAGHRHRIPSSPKAISMGCCWSMPARMYCASCRRWSSPKQKLPKSPILWAKS